MLIEPSQYMDPNSGINFQITSETQHPSTHSRHFWKPTCFRRPTINDLLFSSVPQRLWANLWFRSFINYLWLIGWLVDWLTVLAKTTTMLHLPWRWLSFNFFLMYNLNNTKKINSWIRKKKKQRKIMTIWLMNDKKLIPEVHPSSQTETLEHHQQFYENQTTWGNKIPFSNDTHRFQLWSSSGWSDFVGT